VLGITDDEHPPRGRLDGEPLRRHALADEPGTGRGVTVADDDGRPRSRLTPGHHRQFGAG
jgi:hypothetical protein